MTCGNNHAYQLRRHILKDIDPYVCLFPDCKADTLFKSPEEWLGHMQWEHTVLWACQSPGHEECRYDTQPELERHLLDNHRDSFHESHLPEILQQSALPAPDTFAILALSIPQGAESPRVEAQGTHQCPLCQKRFPLLGTTGTQTTHDETTQNHLLAHLETIALMSLPPHEGRGCDASCDMQQSSSDGERRVRDQGELSSYHSGPSSLGPEDPMKPYQVPQESIEQLEPGVISQHEQSWEEVIRAVKSPALPDPVDDPLLAELLLKGGADVDAEDEDGRTASSAEQAAISPPSSVPRLPPPRFSVPANKKTTMAVILLLGPIGSGKSTFVQHVAKQQARGDRKLYSFTFKTTYIKLILANPPRS